jgi:hypothetical protein
MILDGIDVRLVALKVQNVVAGPHVPNKGNLVASLEQKLSHKTFIFKHIVNQLVVLSVIQFYAIKRSIKEKR